MSWLLYFGAFMLGGTLGAMAMAIVASSRYQDEPFNKDAERFRRKP